MGAFLKGIWDKQSKANELINQDDMWKRGLCADIPRPCVFIRCQYHLIHESTQRHKIFRGTDDEIASHIVNMTDSCTLDLADEGGVTLERVGQALNMTRERVRQIEDNRSDSKKWRGGGAIQKIKKYFKYHGPLQDFIGQGENAGLDTPEKGNFMTPTRISNRSHPRSRQP